MRKREIHTVAHWCMMFLLLMFPLLMVGISTFGSDETIVNVNYKYETNEINNIDDLVVGNIYSLNIDYDNLPSSTVSLFNCSYVVYDYFDTNGQTTKCEITCDQLNDSVFFVQFIKSTNNYLYIRDLTTQETYVDNNILNIKNLNFVYSGNMNANFLSWVQQGTYNEIDSVDISSSSYKDDVNSWVNGFLDLPINAWYKSLMNVIGVGFTNSTVMNVIYVMPVYILWVFIFDVIVDCFLVIIKLPHKLLNRLSGGENE